MQRSHAEKWPCPEGLALQLSHAALLIAHLERLNYAPRVLPGSIGEPTLGIRIVLTCPRQVARFRSAARVVGFMHTLEAFTGDVRVYLGRGKVAMAEEQLHDTKVRAMVEQMRGERVAQHVR